MTYGLDTWYTPPHFQPGGKKRRGSVKALKAFEQIQRKALLTISGALRSSPTDTLETLCSLLPMELLLKKICHRALMRINTLPSPHPLNDVAKKAYQKRAITKHAPPLHALPRILDTPSPSSIEKISPPKRAFHTKPSFETCIPQNKEKALETALNDQAELISYSDGSGLEGMAGAAAVLMRKGINEPIGKVRFQLGPLKEHTTFDAESVGILLSLHLLQQHIEELHSPTTQV